MMSCDACSKCFGDGSTSDSSRGRPELAHSRCAVATASSSVDAQDVLNPPCTGLSPPDPRRRFRPRVHLSLLDGEVRTPAVDEPAVLLPPYHVDGLLDHLEPLLRRRPLDAGDVLVQCFTSTDAKHEAAVVQYGARRGHLGYDRRVQALDRARDGGGDRDRHGLAWGAPIMEQTNGLGPCPSFHGWSWSEIHNP